MDLAVSLVQTYLRVNGYFTVTEFPLVEAGEHDDYRSATDLDLLACRFPDAGQVVLGPRPTSAEALVATDPPLLVPSDRVDMIVGEVKESAAGFNRAGLRREVMAAALARFGCCPAGTSALGLADALLAEGVATTHAGHQIRLIAFGGHVTGQSRYLQIGLHSVIRYLEDYIRGNWATLKTTQSKDDALAFLMLREKVRRTGHEPTAAGA